MRGWRVVASPNARLMGTHAPELRYLRRYALPYLLVLNAARSSQHRLDAPDQLH
jgi:hypothetical protein